VRVDIRQQVLNGANLIGPAWNGHVGDKENITDNKTDIPAKPSPESHAGVPATVEMPEFKPESAFLHEIHTGACTLFGTVLGPEANEAHKDHFHYDLAERKHANYCE
jgi:hypothetical protein